MQRKARFWAYLLACAAIGIPPTACHTDKITNQNENTNINNNSNGPSIEIITPGPITIGCAEPARVILVHVSPDTFHVDFKSNDSTIATVDENGGVVGVSSGDVLIIVTAHGTSKSKAIEVIVKCASAPPPQHTLTVVVTPPTDTLRFGGQNSSGVTCSNSVPLTATVSFDGAKVTPTTLTWQSDNTSVATVDQNGKVVALTSGTVHITASAAVNGLSASGGNTTLSVPCNSSTPPPQTITINPIPRGQFGQNCTTASFDFPQFVLGVQSGQHLTFASSNTSVATVSLAGSITTVGVGSTDLRATVVETGATATGSYQVVTCGSSSNLVQLTATPTTKSLCPGESWQNLVSGKLSDGTAVDKPSVVWSVSQSGFVNLDANTGMMSWATGSGNVSVKATSTTNPGVVSNTIAVATTATCPINNPVISVGITPAGGSVTMGLTQQFTATVATQAGVTDQTVTWSTGDPTVGTITQDGVFHPIKVGTTTVVATSNADQTKFASVTVNVVAAAPTIAVTGPNGEVGSMNLSVSSAGALPSATVTNRPASGQVVWFSSDASIASVNQQTGFITINPGVTVGVTFTVTAQWSTDPTVRGSITVHTTS